VSKENETGAHRALTDTSRLRITPRDPWEDTQPMPVADRRMRQHEALHGWQWIEPFERMADFRDHDRQAQMTPTHYAQQNGGDDV
jgi:hypothetical protein